MRTTSAPNSCACPSASMNPARGMEGCRISRIRDRSIRSGKLPGAPSMAAILPCSSCVHTLHEGAITSSSS